MKTSQRSLVRELTRQLLHKINAHGTRSEQVRSFIVEHAKVEGFEDLALMMIILVDQEDDGVETSPRQGRDAAAKAVFKVT